ncbi:MAG TPA: PP2C family protein-serine/threonine phosphatase, partial [Candidatus Ozemobacteraceae bacterium]|nr:PP2C family protein-serine/threonine phosphatase [Candidatus Ozemobacteraceae bacterium]
PAALLSITVQDSIRQRALLNVDYNDPASVLKGLNETFQMEDHDNLYFTLWYGVYNLRERRLRVSVAGHPPGLLAQSGSESLQKIGVRNPFIGGFPDIIFQTTEVDIPQGSSLYIFTDGVFEITKKDGTKGTFDDFERFLTSLVQTKSDSLPSVYKGMLPAGGAGDLEDDFTIVKISFR